MDRFGDIGLDFNQPEVNIDDTNWNAIWVDLDKGLLADNLGEKCESVVKIGQLFDKYPLPIFVNSGFLRLAKVFQNGNNYLKYQVIEAMEKSQKHLAKVQSVEEVCRLIFYNIHSNDWTCRALTIKALGAIAPIIPDKHNVQHSIRLALESADEMEARQAVYAAKKFCALSKTFATAIFDRVSELIEDIHTPLDRKMQLVPLLVYMHHDVVIAAKAKNLCKSMFYSFPRDDISEIILNTLTQIACKSVTNIHETITFFIKLLHEEPHEKLQLALLKNLNVFAKQVQHLWTTQHINDFVRYVSDACESHVLVLPASRILCTLIKNSTNIHFYLAFDTNAEVLDDRIDTDKLKELIEMLIFSDDRDIALNMCVFTTDFLLCQKKRSAQRQNNDTMGEESSSHLTVADTFELAKTGLFAIILQCDKSIEQFNLDENQEGVQKEIKMLKRALKCTLELAQIMDNNYLNELYAFISSLLNSTGVYRSDCYCDTLLTLCRFENHHEEPPINDKQAFIASVFNTLSGIQTKHKVFAANLQLKLINLLFELHIRGGDLEDYGSAAGQAPLSAFRFIDVSIERFLAMHERHLWHVCKLARLCVRYGYYARSGGLYEKLATELITMKYESTADLSYKGWLDFMTLLCRAEALITQSSISSVRELTEKLQEAMSCYLRAVILFKATCTLSLTDGSRAVPSLETAATSFQVRFCELRAEHIKLYVQLVMSSMTYVTVPPPVFQFNSSDGFNRTGHIAQQMKYANGELQKLAQKYKELLAECFDADRHTLNILGICKRQVECLVFCINALILPKADNVLTREFTAAFLTETTKMGTLTVSSNENSDELAAEVIENSAEMKMSDKFFMNIFAKLKVLCKEENRINQIKQFQGILVDFTRSTIPLPRIFFNTLQKTHIKLIINPNTKKTNTILTIRNDQTLVVKIDGIISQTCKLRAPIRSVQKVQVCLTTELDPKSTPDPRNAKYCDVKTSLEEPRNDYFNSHMLVSFPCCGMFSVQVDLNIVDNEEMLWRYAAEKHQIMVRVDEDPARQKLFQAAAAAANVITGSYVPVMYQHQPVNYRSAPTLEAENTEKMES